MTGAMWATISGIGFGFFQAFNRRAGRAIDVYFSTFILIAISGAILVIASLLMEDLSRLSSAPWRAYINFGLAGILHFYIGWTFLVISQNKVGASRTAVLSGSSPLFALFISAMAFDEFLRLPVLAGVFMLMIGVYLVSGTEDSAGKRIGPKLRDSLFGLGTALCFSISPIFIRGGLKDLPSPLLGVTIGMGFSTLAYGVSLLLRRNRLIREPITKDALFFQIAASAFVGFSTWTRWIALDKAPVSVVLSLGRLNVPVVILLSPLLVGKAAENVTRRVWLGAALIVGGSIILNFYG